MSRWISVLILIVVLIVAGAWLSWYFAYGIADTPPGDAHVQGLSAPVQIGWQAEGYAVVKAQSEADAFAALGYAQGVRDGWTALLLRQTALGRLAEWFGDDLLPLDRFTRRLELAYTARRVYDSLPEGDRSLLDAYTYGLNAALESRMARISDELSLLGVEPEPWEPWQTLAVERLYAWLASPPPPPDTLRRLSTDAQDFYRSDALLRQWLHLHGFQNSIALAYADSQAVHFYERQVYGASALMPYSEAILEWPGHRIEGASLTGTPFFPAARSETRVWALLPHGTARLVHTLEDTTLTKPRYERMQTSEGQEQLLALNRTGKTIYFETPPKPRPAPPDSALLRPDSTGADTLMAAARPDTARMAPDSTWALQWSGFTAGSDFEAWRALASGQAAPFSLLDAAGLMMDPSGQIQVIGRPVVVVQLARGVVAGNTMWARFVAQDLDTLLTTADTPPSVATATTDYRSTWAATLAPGMVASVDSIPDRVPLVNEAITFLHNWDYSYDRASIAAAIFDTWVATYREHTGHLPQINPPDSLFFENMVRYQALGRAVSELRRDFGDDMSQWRWENVNPDRRLFPVWSADTLIDLGVGRFAQARYGPISLPGRGHPSALYWGASPIQQEPPSPAMWEAWVSTDAWDRLFVRRLTVDLDTPLGRYRTPDRVPAPIVLTPEPHFSSTTTLLPSQAPS